MEAVVVYESMFGNTRDVADAVAEGLRSRMEVRTVEVGEAPSTIGADTALLVVGGPTHAFGMTRPRTRADAALRVVGPVISSQRGVREWLATVVAEQPGTRAAAFDTRIRARFPTGSAARGVLGRLRRARFSALGPVQSFYVADVEGPLHPGELERAREWGESLATFVLAATAKAAPTVHAANGS